MSLIEDYKAFLLEGLHCRVEGDTYGEDMVYDRLDRVWYEMTAAEMDAINDWSRGISEEYLGENGEVIKPLPDKWD